MTILSALAGDAEIEALLSDEATLAALLAVERALAEASAEAGWIGAADAEAIGTAVDRFVPDWPALAAGMAQDGVVIPALVRQLRAALPQAHREGLHKGATSQDIIDTALVLQLAQVLDVYDTRLAGVLARLDRLARDWAGRPLLAHTRMQAALPSHWDAKLMAWSEPLARQARALTAMRRSLLVVQLGGPVGDRASFGGRGDAIAAGLAQRLDLGRATPWHTARDPIVALGGQLALIAGLLGKIGADVALLSQTELGALRLEGGGGSSAMAHKSNPVNAEVLVALARSTAGLAGTLNQALVHEYERSGAAWTLEWLTLPPLLVQTGASLRLAQALLDQLRLPG